MNSNEKAYELLSVLEDVIPTIHPNIKDFTIVTDYDNDSTDSRAGISSTYNSFENGCNHFFFFSEKYGIYFSKNVISVRYNTHFKTDKIYQGSFDEFFELHLQLNTVHDLLPLDFYKRMHNISQNFKWKIK